MKGPTMERDVSALLFDDSRKVTPRSPGSAPTPHSRSVPVDPVR